MKGNTIVYNNSEDCKERVLIGSQSYPDLAGIFGARASMYVQDERGRETKRYDPSGEQTLLYVR